MGGTDGTGSPGPGGYGRPKRRPNGDVILIIALILVGAFSLRQKFFPAILGTKKVFLAVDHFPEGFFLRDICVASLILDHHSGQAGPGLWGLASSAEVLKKTDDGIDKVGQNQVVDQSENAAHHRNTLDDSSDLVKWTRAVKIFLIPKSLKSKMKYGEGHIWGHTQCVSPNFKPRSHHGFFINGRSEELEGVD
jgi:hypothetical protein